MCRTFKAGSDYKFKYFGLNLKINLEGSKLFYLGLPNLQGKVQAAAHEGCLLFFKVEPTCLVS